MNSKKISPAIHFIFLLFQRQQTLGYLLLLLISLTTISSANKLWINTSLLLGLPGLTEPPCYYGRWRNGLPDGYGCLFEIDGSVYKGYFSEGRKHGEGKIKYPDGSRFKGIFNHGIVYGRGTYTGTDKRKINGFFDATNGRDRSITPDDETNYFKTTKCTGKGTIILPGKRIYSGDISGGMMHGKGIIKWPNGIAYEGDFLNDHIEGQGRIFNTLITEGDNTICEGFFEHDYFLLYVETIPDEYKSITSGILLKNPFSLRYNSNPEYAEWQYILDYVKENPVNPVTKKTLIFDWAIEQGIDRNHKKKIKRWLKENAVLVSRIVSEKSLPF